MLALAAPIAAAQPSENEVKRINEAAAVIRELHTTPDKDIPQSIWDKAKCVIVVPGLKRAAFVFGGEYGKGVASCRKSDGGWTPPSFVQIAKGTWGAQIGAAEVDLVMLVTNERGVEKMLRNKVTLGAEASAAAGPVGRDAQAATDAVLQAEILAWSRSRGLFAGVNVGGGQLSPDEESNRNLYGRAITAREILVDGKAPQPAAAKPFADALREHDVPKRTAR
jgi:lipid-binding SYLF domain-containing protein